MGLAAAGNYLLKITTKQQIFTQKLNIVGH
jgi:hypothetical protein